MKVERVIAGLARSWPDPANIALPATARRRDGEPALGSVDLRFVDGDFEDVVWPPRQGVGPGPHVLRTADGLTIDYDPQFETRRSTQDDGME